MASRLTAGQPGGTNFRNADLATLCLPRLKWHFSVSFNPDGSLLATGDVDGKICLWRDGQQVLITKGHAGWIGPSLQSHGKR